MSADLRAAEFNNHWRRLSTNQYQTRLDSLTFQNLSCLQDDSITFETGITAIIGGNGVGKSAVAASIADLLFGTQSDAQYWRVHGSTLSGIGRFRGKPRHFFASDDRLSNELAGNSFGWLDPSFPTVILRALHEDANPQELLEGVEPVELSEDDLAQISYMVNKKYDGCLIYEIEDYGQLPTFPYFTVRIGGGISYSSEGMGAGEFSLLIHFWMLRKLQKNSILVLEEPETFISPRSQLALMNMVARASDKRGFWTIITTHSPTILRRVPLGSIRLLTQSEGRSVVTKKTTQQQIDELLGEGSSHQACILVEDQGAKSFFRSILERHASDLLSEIEIRVAGDKDKVRKVIEGLPVGLGLPRVVAVFDGGMETEMAAIRGHWPVIFLPGGKDPDHVLKLLAESDQIRDRLAERLYQDPEQVLVACNELTGIDHHDWPLRMSQVLNSSVDVMRRLLTDLWLDIEENRTLAAQLVSQLRDALSSNLLR